MARTRSKTDAEAILVLLMRQYADLGYTAEQVADKTNSTPKAILALGTRYGIVFTRKASP